MPNAGNGIGLDGNKLSVRFYNHCADDKIGFMPSGAAFVQIGKSHLGT